MARSARVYITADVSGLEQGAARASRSLDHTTAAGERLGVGLGQAARRIAGFAIALTGIGSAVHFAESAVSTTVELAHSSEKLAAATGMSVKESSRWVEAAKVHGLGSKQLTMAFITLSKNIEKSTGSVDAHGKALDALKVKQAAELQIAEQHAAGMKDQTKAQQYLTVVHEKQAIAIAALTTKTAGATDLFAKFGVSQKLLASGNTEQILIKVADAFGFMTNPAERAADAQKLFGRGAQALLPILNQGGAAVKAMLGQTAAYGAELSGNTSKSTEKALQVSREWQLAMDGLKVMFAEKILPALLPVVQGIMHFVVQMEHGKGPIGEIINWLDKLPPALKSLLPALGLVAAGFATGGPWGAAIAAAGFGVFQIVQHWDQVKRATSGLAASVAASLGISKADLKSFGDAAVQVFDRIRGFITDVFIPVFRFTFGLLKPIFDGIILIFRGTLDVMVGLVKVFAGLFTGNWRELWNGVSQIFGGVFKVLQGTLTAVLGTMINAGITFGSKFLGIFNSIFGGIAGVATNAVNSVTGVFSSGFNSLLSWLGGLPGNFTSVARSLVDAFTAPFSFIASGIEGIMKGAINSLLYVVNQAINVFNTAVDSAYSVPVLGGALPGGLKLSYVNYLASGGKVNAQGLFIAGEEAPQHPEYIISTNPRDRSRMVPLVLEAAAHLGIVGHKTGAKKKKASSPGFGAPGPAIAPAPISAPPTLTLTFGDQDTLLQAGETAADIAGTGQAAAHAARLLALQTHASSDLTMLGGQAPTYAGLVQKAGVAAGLQKRLQGQINVARGELRKSRLTAHQRAVLNAQITALQRNITDQQAIVDAPGAYANQAGSLIRDYASTLSSIQGEMQWATPASAGGAPGALSPASSPGSVGGIGGVGGGGPTTPPPPTPDDQALIDQANLRAYVAQTSARLSEGALSAFTGSGDIGAGGRNALNAATVININTLHPADPATLSAIGNAAVAGIGLQGLRGSTTSATGV